MQALICDAQLLMRSYAFSVAVDADDATRT
jgi:hypothetical protein